MTEEEYFRKNYPNSCYGDKPLSPHWDFFQDGVEFGERQSEKRIEELEKENAELKAVERMALYSRMSDRLAKAEELLLELYDCIPSSMADSCKETLQKVALFFKDSEVAK